jgi:glycosyltransferase involved in cell wall biosynthesis
MAAEPTPDVINLPNSLLIGLAAPLRQALSRPICCTLQGEELFLNGLVPPYREQALSLMRAQVSHVDRFIAVSDYCAGFMSDLLAIPASRISVVPLGISMRGYARRREAREEFRIGYFARIAEEKGLHVLADAYVQLRRRTGRVPMRLEAAGHLTSTAAPYLSDVCRTLEFAGIGHEFTYRGEVDRAGKIAFLRGLDVLSVPASYDEPKGIFLLEAMASGVPVVQPMRGGFTEIVQRTGGGLLVAPDDTAALAEGLYTLWSDRQQLRALGDRAYDGVREHYTVAKSADRLLQVYESVVDSTVIAPGSVP